MVNHCRVSNPGVNTVAGFIGKIRMCFFCFTTCSKCFYIWSSSAEKNLFYFFLRIFVDFYFVFFDLYLPGDYFKITSLDNRSLLVGYYTYVQKYTQLLFTEYFMSYRAFRNFHILYI